VLQRTPLAATPSASAALDPNGVEQRKDRFMLIKNVAVGDSAGNDNQDERQSIKSPPLRDLQHDVCNEQQKQRSGSELDDR